MANVTDDDALKATLDSLLDFNLPLYNEQRRTLHRVLTEAQDAFWAQAIGFRRERDEREIELQAWASAFGTSQLTHATERLRLAERERDERQAACEKMLPAETQRALEHRVAELERERDEARALARRLHEAATTVGRLDVRDEAEAKLREWGMR